MNAPTQSEMLDAPQVHMLTDKERAEVFRKKLLPSRPDLLTPVERNIASAEHECRTLNQTEQACARLMQDATSACVECLRRSGFTPEDLKREHPLDGK